MDLENLIFWGLGPRFAAKFRLKVYIGLSGDFKNDIF